MNCSMPISCFFLLEVTKVMTYLAQASHELVPPVVGLNVNILGKMNLFLLFPLRFWNRW